MAPPFFFVHVCVCMLVCVHSYIWVNVCTCVCTRMRQPESMLGVFVHHFPPNFFKAGFLTDPGAHQHTRLDDQANPRICLSLPAQHWAYKHVPQCSDFNASLGESNSGPHVCVGGILPTKIPWPLNYSHIR